MSIIIDNNLIEKLLMLMKHLFFLFLLCATLGCILSCSSDKEEDAWYITLNYTELTFDANQDSQRIQVSSNGDWEVLGENNWCKVEPTHEKGDHSVIITVSKNESTDERQCKLTFQCHNATATLEIYQHGSIQSNYVDLGLDTEEIQITRYDPNSGQIQINYGQASIPNVTPGQVLVLPETYQYGIRVIKDVKVSGNNLTLQTQEGNMANLFQDISFELLTNPNQQTQSHTRGSQRRIITPQSIRLLNPDGTSEIIYDRNTPLTRNESYPFEEDFAGTELYNGDYGRIWWEKCHYSILLDGKFYFDFGKTLFDKIPIGDLRNFSYSLQGNYNLDCLLKYNFSKEIQSKKEFVKENIIPQIVFNFLVGNVPVFITINTDLKSEVGFQAKAEINAEAGVSLEATSQLGLSWSKGNIIEPIHELNTSFNLYPPTMQIKGALEAKASIYPQLGINLYNFAGPWLAVMPYINLDLKAGVQTSTEDENKYIGWKSNLHAGAELNMGLSMGFGLVEPYEWTIPQAPFNLIDKTILEAPYRIQLVSPEEEEPVMIVGKETEVIVKVTSHSNYFDDEKLLCPYACVKFITDDESKLDQEYVMTDMEGLAKVTWTPMTTQSTLTAQVVDENGNVLVDDQQNEVGKVELKPILESWQLSLVSPEQKNKMELNVPQPIVFRVDLKDVNDQTTPKANTEVCFTSLNMKKQTLTTDTQGLVSIDWAPSSTNDKLTAQAILRIQDPEQGEQEYVMATQQFTPTIIMPQISLYSPENQKEVEPDKPIQVSFLVKYTTNGETFAYPNRTVILKPSNAEAYTTESNEKGLVTVTWTPQNPGDQLKAELYDAQNQTLLGSAVFAPVVTGTIIELISPLDGKINQGESITATFCVKKSPGNQPLANVPVIFSAGSGSLSQQSAHTDAQGKVSVVWTPSENGTLLTASLANNPDRIATLKAYWTDNGIAGVWQMTHIKITEDGVSEEGDFTPEMGIITLTIDENGRYTYYSNIKGAGGDDPDEIYTEKGRWEYSNQKLILYADTGNRSTLDVVSLEDTKLITHQSELGYSETRTWTRQAEQ